MSATEPAATAALPAVHGMPRRTVQWFIVLVLVVAYPLAFRDGFHITIAVNVGVALILTLSMNLVIGFSGQFSLAHAAFFGIGGYVPAILARDLGLSPWLGLPIAVSAGVLIAIIIGIPVVRLRGYYLAVATFAFSFFVEIVARQATELTGGAYGIQNLSAPSLFGAPLQGALYYPLVVVAVLVTLAVLGNLMRSPLGGAIRATRDHPGAASAAGINPAHMRLLAFVVAAGFAALAGWLQAFYFRNLNPLMLLPEWNFVWLFMVFIGGLGHVRGVIAGTILLTVAPEFLGFATEQTILATGVLMVLVALFAPRGLGGLIDRLLSIGQPTARKQAP
jgi:branched-chain amino acid transport system permease protein